MVDPVLIVVGVALLTYPLQYRWHMGRIRERLREGGGDLDRFDRTMGQAWIRATVIAMSVAGAAMILLALIG